MTEPERTGGKTRLVSITIPEAAEIEAAGIGRPKLYYSREKTETSRKSDYVLIYFCEPAELERWRASRINSQAAPAHE